MDGMEPQSVDIFLRSLDNDYQQRLRDDAAQTGGRLGLQVTALAAQNDAAKQRAQVTEALDKANRLVALLVSPVRDDLSDLARIAASKGIGWIVLNREAAYLAELSQEFPSQPLFSIEADQTEVGRIQAQQIKALTRDGDEAVCVTGPAATSSAQRRLEGLRAELGDTPVKLTVLEADWTSEGSRLAISRWFKRLAAQAALPACFCAQNDEMALGARQAIRDAASARDQPDLAQVPITGCDGSPAFGKRLVKEKRIAATVEIPSVSGPALEWIARARKKAETPPTRIQLAVASFPELGKLTRRKA